jgi:hypothetical protein
MEDQDIFNILDDYELDTQVLEINEIMNDASAREKERIIKLLENKLNSIPFKIGSGRTDKEVIRRTIKEVINILRTELDNQHYEKAS